MGFGCNACGVTGCRIIDSPRERLIAILTNSFAPCNGRFPLLIFLCAVFFDAGSAGGALLLTSVIAGSVLLTLAASRLLSAFFLRGLPSLVRAGASALPRAAAGQGDRAQRARPHGVRARPRDDCCGACRCAHLAARKHHGQRQLPVRQHDCLSPIRLGASSVWTESFWRPFCSASPANGLVMPLIVLGYLSGGTLADVSDLLSFRALLLANGWTGCTALCTLLFTICHWPCSTTCLTVFRETRSVRYTLAAIALPTCFGLVLCALVRLLCVPL